VPLTASEAIDVAKGVLKLRQGEQRRLDKIAAYTRGQQASVYVPKGARQEYRWLIKRSKVNILPLVITVVAQALFVEGYRPDKADTDAKTWEIWQANRLDRRQHGLHRAALKYGAAYTIVLPGDPVPVIRPVSPRRLTAVYEDPVDDEWPLYALEEVVQNLPTGRKRLVKLYDGNHRYTLEGKASGGGLTLTEDGVYEHGLGVCPVVRFLDEDDLDGELCGEVEPLYDLQDQLNMTTFGLLMAQQYAAFRQRWVTGMVVQEDENGSPVEPFNSSVSRLWVGEDSDIKFGEFGQTSLDGYLDSREATIRHAATISQTPPHNLLGQMINLSAEALAAAESGLQRKVGERKSTFGESWEQTLRLAGKAAGDTAAWEDTSSQMVWRDIEARSLAQTVDALGKLAQMLNVPVQELWERIPGITQTDVRRWKATAAAGDAKAQLNEIVDRQMKDATGPDASPQGSADVVG
jgi:hypothetical protein